MTIRDYIFPSSSCVHCDRPLTVMFLTICDCGSVDCYLCRHVFFYACGIDRKIINSYLTGMRWVKLYEEAA